MFGFDAEEVYTVRNVRSLRGDRELRRQLAMPKDFCTPLALETNGTLFDLKKMMPGQQQQQTKKFVDIFARRVAATGEPSPCQRCDCIGDRDGIGSILCQRCVSPVMERLDKVRLLMYKFSISIFETNYFPSGLGAIGLRERNGKRGQRGRGDRRSDPRVIAGPDGQGQQTGFAHNAATKVMRIHSSISYKHVEIVGCRHRCVCATSNNILYSFSLYSVDLDTFLQKEIFPVLPLYSIQCFVY